MIIMSIDRILISDHRRINVPHESILVKVNKLRLDLWREVLWLTTEQKYSCILSMRFVLLERRASQCVYSWMFHRHSVRTLVTVSSRLSLESLMTIKAKQDYIFLFAPLKILHSYWACSKNLLLLLVVGVVKINWNYLLVIMDLF